MVVVWSVENPRTYDNTKVLCLKTSCFDWKWCGAGWVWKSPLCHFLPGLQLSLITCYRLQEAVITTILFITSVLILEFGWLNLARTPPSRSLGANASKTQSSMNWSDWHFQVWWRWCWKWWLKAGPDKTSRAFLASMRFSVTRPCDPPHLSPCLSFFFQRRMVMMTFNLLFITSEHQYQIWTLVL